MIKAFLFKLFLFCSLPLVIAFGLQYCIDAGLRKSNQEPFVVWNEIFSGRVKANLLILGSSRAGHFLPEILDTALKKDCYNIGAVAYAFDMQNVKLQCYLKYNRKPDCILQSLDLFTLEGPKNLYNSEQFLPYLDEELIQKGVSSYEGTFPKYYFYIPFIKYSKAQDLLPLGLQLYTRKNKQGQFSFKGYKGSDHKWNNQFNQWKAMFPNGYFQKISQTTCNAFEAYLEYCMKNAIKVILIYSPEYHEAQSNMHNRNAIVMLYKIYAKKHHLIFLDYGAHPICNNRDNFYNGTHLNKKGRILFSAVLANDLKRLIK